MYRLIREQKLSKKRDKAMIYPQRFLNIGFGSLIPTEALRFSYSHCLFISLYQIKFDLVDILEPNGFIGRQNTLNISG